MAYRQYSDADKAAALTSLDLNEGNVYRTAKQLAIPNKTLEEWASGRRISPEVAQFRQHKKAELRARLESVLDRLLQGMEAPGALEAKLDKASLRDVATSVGILIDKIQLLKGEPTNIIAEAARESVKKIMEKTGLTEAEARRIVAEEFEIDEGVIM